MSEEAQPVRRKNLFGFMASEFVLGTLIALLSLFTAISAYQGSLADSKESDFNVEAQKVLSNSNTEFLRANQDIIVDYTMFDGWYINDGKDAEIAEYYLGEFSDQLQSSMDRTEGPFDDLYYEEMYADADETYDEALINFDEAQAAGDKADRYQLVLMVFAVGLSLVAWGSLLKEESPLRGFFSLVGALVLVYGLFNFFGILLG